MSSSTGRTGRRPGTGDTREQILEAARKEFAAKGFEKATTRAIAESAGVNVALLSHYFGGKQQLFTETLEIPDAALKRVVASLQGDLAQAAVPLTHAYLELWEDPAIRSQPIAILRAGITGGPALERLRGLLSGKLIGVTGGDSERGVKIALAMSHLMGVVISRHITTLEPIATMSFDELVDRVAPAIAVYLK